MTAAPAAATDLLAWQFALAGKRLQGLLLWQLMAASLATLLVITFWGALADTQNRAALLPRYRIPIELLGVAVIALAAHVGGFLTGVNP